MSDKPIPGPEPVEGERTFSTTKYHTDLPMTPVRRVARFLSLLIKEPVSWFRETVVEPNRGPKYYWYHRKYQRALPIDECYMDDYACMIEANEEFKRVTMVDVAVLQLLRYRADACNYWYSSTRKVLGPAEECKPLEDTLKRETLNYNIKYGQLKYRATVLHAYNKQKHRMIVERRRALRQQEERKNEYAEEA